MKFRIKILPILAILGLVLLLGCESEKGTAPGPPSDPEGLIAQGWSQYRANDYNGAYVSFNDAINLASAELLAAQEDSVLAPDSTARDSAVAAMNAARVLMLGGLSGAGWTTVKDVETAGGTLAFDLGLGYVAALESMNLADSLEVRRLHAELLGGYASLLQLMWEWRQSNERVAGLLAIDAAWQFDHDSEIDYLDLRLMRAENYYYLADFAASLDEALALNAMVGYQPGLSPEDFNLATIEGRAALIQLIEALDNLI